MQQEKTAANAAPCKFPVWRSIKIGTGLKTADDFRRALTSAGYRIGTWANDILGKPAFKAAAAESTLDLVVASVAELGFGTAPRSPTSTPEPKSSASSSARRKSARSSGCSMPTSPTANGSSSQWSPSRTPSAIRASSTSNSAASAGGSTASAATPTVSGSAAAGSCSSAAISTLASGPRVFRPLALWPPSALRNKRTIEPLEKFQGLCFCPIFRTMRRGSR